MTPDPRAPRRQAFEKRQGTKSRDAASEFIAAKEWECWARFGE
jgi:hypothetical protein